eukprot:3340308-Pyramimonas_sp.AAC.4
MNPNNSLPTRLWYVYNPQDGTLLWEAGQYNPTTPPVAGGTDLIALEKDYDGDDYEDFMTLTNGLVQVRMLCALTASDEIWGLQRCR